MAKKNELAAAQARLARMCGGRPEFQQIAQVTRELLPIVFCDDVRRGSELAATDLPYEDGVPIPYLRSHSPQWDESVLHQNWLRVCEVLAAFEGGARPLATAVENRRFRVADLLAHVLAGSPAKCHELMQLNELDAALGCTVLRLASLPLLASFAERLAPRIASSAWDRGSCPVCGNWPMLAEWRGLEQFRWLRCGWCTSEWRLDRMRCPYCDNRDHRTLRELIVEQLGDRYRLTACDACGQSLPALATLGPLSGPELLVAEAEALPLLIALECSQRRPGNS